MWRILLFEKYKKKKLHLCRPGSSFCTEVTRRVLYSNKTVQGEKYCKCLCKNKFLTRMEFCTSKQKSLIILNTLYTSYCAGHKSTCFEKEVKIWLQRKVRRAPVKGHHWLCLNLHLNIKVHYQFCLLKQTKCCSHMIAAPQAANERMHQPFVGVTIVSTIDANFNHRRDELDS